MRRVDASIKQELEPKELEQDSSESDQNEISGKEIVRDVENLLKEEQKGELVQMDWVRWDEEELLPEGWSYRWHKQKSLKAKSGFKRSLHFVTDAGTKLKSSNEAFKYLVENDFPELDQEKMREFVQSWKNNEKRTDEVEVKKEMFERAEVVDEEAENKLHETEDETAEDEAVDVEEEFPKKAMTDEEKREERRARDREGQRRRRALAKARKSEIKEEDADPSDDNQSGLEEHADLALKKKKLLEIVLKNLSDKKARRSEIEEENVNVSDENQSGLEEHADLALEIDEEEHLDQVEDAAANNGLRESKYEEDPMLPLGWKKATYFLQKNGRALPRFKAPDGTKFGSRAKVGFEFDNLMS